MSARRAHYLQSALLFCVLGSGASCDRPPPDATPEGAVHEMLERIARADTNPDEMRLVYDMLSASTRASLDERAKRVASTTGRPASGVEMLAPFRVALRFEPRQIHARVTGSNALVDVAGIDPTTDHAIVPCVLEDGRWRVEITLPPLEPIEYRPGHGP